MAAVNAVRSKARDAVFAAGGRGFVRFLPDGEEALLCAKEQKFDMILLDIMLPKLSGTEVCQLIREFSDVPIVMLTAKNDVMDKIMGLEYGADDYITKPFNILEVKARIKAIMRSTSARGQIAKPESSLEG